MWKPQDDPPDDPGLPKWLVPGLYPIGLVVAIILVVVLGLR